MKKGYIPQEKRKKIMLLCDDIRMHSGISTMAREIVLGTAHVYNWVNVGGAINHPDQGKRMDLSQDTNNMAGITDSSIILYPTQGYGSRELVRALIDIEKPDAIMLFTDPRYWVWLFQIEHEIRKTMPIIYLNIWDDLPAPLYNKPYYESCDCLMAISKQTEIINHMVLGDKAKDRVIKYVPHGINEKVFHPITEFMADKQKQLNELRSKVFGKDVPEFVVFYNARNIRRKSVPDLIAAWAQFTDKIGKDKAKKCALLMHTHAIDEHGTDLPAVIENTCDPSYQKVYINNDILTPEQMNMLYNMADVTALISSNEGWGLSLTESLMAGKMIIANVTGGMQDQMRFVDKKGQWIKFSERFPSNHFGTYKECGKWAVPVFPSNMSLNGSVPTPYIWDDRCDFRDVAKAIEDVYNISAEERHERGLAGREWVTSSESMMSAANMCSNVIEAIDQTFKTFVPKPEFEFIKTGVMPAKKMPHPLTY
jgi:glycosyltransferase involved in cell wall biosynthesis